jgi:hypothetical protein
MGRSAGAMRSLIVAIYDCARSSFALHRDETALEKDEQWTLDVHMDERPPAAEATGHYRSAFSVLRSAPLSS